MKIFIIIVLLFISFFLTYYFIIIIKISIVYTHFFYLPIILACLWWKKKGLVVPIFLAGLLIFVPIIYESNIIHIDDIFRAFIFMIIGVVVATLSEKIAKTEVNLKESKEKYKSIIEDIQEGYYEVDLKGNFTFVNESFCEIFEYSRDELMGVNYGKYLDDKTKNELFKVSNKIFRTGKIKNNIQFNFNKKDGEKIFTESSLNLKYDSDGNKIGFSGLIRDISKQKEIERLIDKYNRQLAKEVEDRTKDLKKALDKQKLYLDQILKSSQFKTDFMATMSHELRTPLNAIIGFTDLLLEGAYGSLNDEQLEFVKDIKSSAEYQFGMVKHILDISNIDAEQLTLNVQKFSINNIVEQVRSSLAPSYTKKKLKFELKGLDTEKEIYADPVRFKEILYNIIDNAIKFTIEGKITFIFKEDDEKWIFEIKDTGIGIAREDFDSVFQEFKRGSSNYVLCTEGTGLGLSVTKRLVNLHGGNITFTSKLGVGSTFTFTIHKKLGEKGFSK